MPSGLMRWAPAIAAIALLVLVVTAFQAWSLSRRLSDVDERLRLATNDVLDLEGRVIPIEQKSGQWLDAVRVARGASPAVFTIVAANGQGSGFGFYTDGDVTYIATNYHVVAGTAEAHQRVEVHQDGRRWFGITEIWDRNSDVALVRVDEDLPVLISAYGEGHDPALGDPVLAFGTPVGLEGSATQGIISALRRGVIQTDAQINPGNSGGPLLNRYGEVLGLTTAGIGAGSGLGFAVDIREVCALAGDHAC
jgi:S1-C subfamily serine protease